MIGNIIEVYKRLLGPALGEAGNRLSQQFGPQLQQQAQNFQRSPLGAVVQGRPQEFAPRLKQALADPAYQQRTFDAVVGGFGAHGGTGGGFMGGIKKVPTGGVTKNLGEITPQVKAMGRQSTPEPLPPQTAQLRPLQTNQSSLPLTESISDPVNKIIAAIKEAKPLRKEQDLLYSQERSKRVARVAAVGKNVQGEKGFFAQLGQLKGELPKVQFESIRPLIQQTDVDDLFNRVEGNNILSPFEKVSAKGGLAKLLGAEGGAVPTPSELKLLNEIFPPEFTQAIMSKRSTSEKVLAGVGEALNLPRSIMSTFDLSAPLRQGIFLVGRPKEFVPAFGSMFKYAFSEKAYDNLAAQIQSRPTYPLMRQSQLALTDLGPQLAGREEAFMSNLVEKLPVLGGASRASSRAYSGFLNKLRADVFDDLYGLAKKEGILVERPGVVDDIAKFVNSATGRGDLGALNRAAVVLNGIFFSPRLMASRINLLNPKFYVDLDPLVRKEALKSLLTFGSTAVSVLTLAKMGGAEVEADPRSSDFAKIKFGNTRYDILGGFQQYLKLAAQLATGKMISTTTGKETTLGEGYKAPTRMDILQRFFENKEAPVASFVTTILRGQNAVGEKTDLPVEVVNRFIPMIVGDMYETAKEWGPAGIAMALPGALGVSVQTYGRKEPRLETTPTGDQTVKMKAVSDIGQDIVNKFRGQPERAEINPYDGSTVSQQEVYERILAGQKDSAEEGKVKDQVASSGQPGESPSKIFYVGPNGTIESVQKDRKIVPPQLTSSAELNKELISTFSSQLTSKINDVETLYKLGKLTAEEAGSQISAIKALQAEVKKVTAKPKKGKKPKVIKISAKLKKLKPLTFKKTKPRKVKQYSLTKVKALT